MGGCARSAITNGRSPAPSLRIALFMKTDLRGEKGALGEKALFFPPGVNHFTPLATPRRFARRSPIL
jgi:hypothetical protein